MSDRSSASPAPLPRRDAVVVLDTGTWVVDGGVEHRRWRVLLDGVWRNAEAVPAAMIELAGEGEDTGTWLVRPPGCQYLSRCQVRLAVGTELELIVTRPLSLRQPSQKDPILSWFRHSRPRRKTIVRRYRVGREGSLVGEEVWLRRRKAPRDP